jgi:hypothetical protein
MNSAFNPFADIVFLASYARAHGQPETEVCEMYQEGKAFLKKLKIFAGVLVIIFLSIKIIQDKVPSLIYASSIFCLAVLLVSPIIVISFKPAIGSIALYRQLHKRIRYIRAELHGRTTDEVSLPAPFGSPEEQEASPPTLDSYITILRDAFETHLYSKGRQVERNRHEGVALLNTDIHELSELLTYGRNFGLVDPRITLESLI